MKGRQLGFFVHQSGLSANGNRSGADDFNNKMGQKNLDIRLSNSVKFTPDGGRICLSARVLASPPAREDGDGNENDTGLPRGWGQKGCLRIFIQDTGIGLEKKDFERIFLPFEQGDNSVSRKYEGAGLGLTLTKELVELHSGKIWVESPGLGKGSTFYVDIPLQQMDSCVSERVSE